MSEEFIEKFGTQQEGRWKNETWRRIVRCDATGFFGENGCLFCEFYVRIELKSYGHFCMFSCVSGFVQC